MIPGFERIVEERIKAAREKGAFDHLEGAGKPLALFDDLHVPEDLRMAYKILKNADCLPPEIELKKEISRTEDLLAGMQDESERYRTLKKLNVLIMKLNVSRNGDARFDIPQKYAAAVVDRLSADAKKGSPGR